jgi:hypothetical protein
MTVEINIVAGFFLQNSVFSIFVQKEHNLGVLLRFFSLLLSEVALFPIGVVFSFFQNYLTCEKSETFSEKNWYTNLKKS